MKNDNNKNEQINDENTAMNDTQKKIETDSAGEENNSIANEVVKKLEAEINDYKDRLLRKAAEFENFKRRTETNQLNLIKYDGESFITNMLTVVDDFERSIQHFDTTKEIEPLKAGIKLVYDKLIKILNEQGVQKIDAVGKPFDVHLHEAILQRREEGAEPHTVLDEIEKGYMYKDKVIRHSKVIVSEDVNETEAAETPGNTENKTEGE
ncbi:MAG: nucleotide exchange factor GrpE [Ignavibacteriales bacterium]|nr:MAG: nucleotide exchange factor GrpE [Ignavibacteriales bacterium]